MRRRKFNKPLATALSFIFCLSLAGCGKKEVVVDDYGQGANTEQSTSTDAEEYATGDGKTLQDKFGKWAKWNDSFSIQGMSAKVNTSIPIPDSDYLNV